jgi:tetratricopeptide (TPR) repeat protein
MPEMTGLQLLNRIRDDRMLRDMPVVMVTAEAREEVVAEAAESEIDAYLIKPITVKSLEERVRMVLEKANNPPPMFFHLRRARDLEESGDMEGAVAEAAKAMEANPSSSRPIRELGYLFYKKGDLAEAEKWLIKAAGQNRMDVFAVHYLGDLYLRRGDLDRAAHYYEQAMRISPRHLERGLNFGKILLEKNMTSEALKVFSNILVFAEDRISLREEIAAICTEKGEYRYAIGLYSFILQQLPGRVDIMSKLVDAYVCSGDPKKAMPYLAEMEKRETKDVGLLLKIARLYIELNQTVRADLVLQKVDKIDPGNAEAKKLLREYL